MRALELDVLRAQAERLVDDEIGDQRADPGDRDVGIERQRLLQRLVDADLHQAAAPPCTLNTSQTTRPGWLWVRREKKFDQAIEPA